MYQSYFFIAKDLQNKKETLKQMFTYLSGLVVKESDAEPKSDFYIYK